MTRSTIHIPARRLIMNAQPATSALQHTNPVRATAGRKSGMVYMSDQQVQAYLVAREALRRARQAAATLGAETDAEHRPSRLRTRH
jgi:hypothetical protein